MSLALPRWADCTEGRTLLAAIRLEQPDFFPVHRYAWVNARYPRYKGKNASALRKLWKDTKEAALDVDPELFSETCRSDPDELIERMLNEQTVPFTPMELKDLGDGTHRVAA